MEKKILSLILMVSLFCLCAECLAQEQEMKFPTPEFSINYQIPSAQHPAPRSDWFEYMDVLILLAALAMASYLALKKRSRQGLFLMTVFSVVYFGFYKKGCVCSVGSIQNVVWSFASESYVLPITVLCFFMLPIIFSLFYGRVFCSSVCPLGAIQELFIYKPKKIPQTLKHLLSIIPYLYLGLVVLFTATKTGFFICKYDPFIGFYRLSGNYIMFLTGSFFLLLGIFIARPYCRFFCPYGIILGFFSFFSKKYLKIHPTDCIQCKLCEDSCPVEAIEHPSPLRYKTKIKDQVKKMVYYILLIPVLMAVMGFSVSRLADFLAQENRIVRLSEELSKGSQGLLKINSLEGAAFIESARSIESLNQEAKLIKNKFYLGTWLLGCFLGFVFSLKLIILMVRYRREDYEPNRFHCLSCGRCMEYCPVKEN